MALFRVAFRVLLPLQLIVITFFAGLTIGAIGAIITLLARGSFAKVPTELPITSEYTHVVLPLPTAISPIFSPGVQHWNTQIVKWGQTYGIDPNLIATVMQIESCGDSFAGSYAGAQGLFQVMPFHFQSGDDPLDPETNAEAGLAYLRGAIIRADGHLGLALAGYNGGYGVIDTGWAKWSGQTRDYYLWGTAIYLDAFNGKSTSPALQDWLDAGGARLCQQAIDHLTATPTVSPTPTMTPTVTATSSTQSTQ